MMETQILRRVDIQVTNLAAMCLIVFGLNMTHGLDELDLAKMDDELDRMWLDYLCRIREMEAFFSRQLMDLRDDQVMLLKWRAYHIEQIGKAQAEYMLALSIAIQARPEDELEFDYEQLKPAHQAVDDFLLGLKQSTEQEV